MSLIRCTVPTPTPNAAAILWMRLPPTYNAAWMLCSAAGSIFRRPKCVALLVPCARAPAMPALMRRQDAALPGCQRRLSVRFPLRGRG